ncbi:MAG: phosphoenolpyruvate kinase [Acidobacteriota bacterium]
MDETTIPVRGFTTFLGALGKENVRVTNRLHGESSRRQPVHTFNGGAHLFKADTIHKLGTIALQALQQYGSDSHMLADVIGYEHSLAQRIYARVVDKLSREPIEDYRIDFEEGFGNRPDVEEDHFARSAAEEMAAALKASVLPLGIGIRIKPLHEELEHRSLRTFDLFLTRLLDCSGNVLPPNFVVTLPKITSPEQVAALTAACQAFEYWRGLPADSLRLEIMIETPQSIFADNGTVALPRLIEAGRGRIVAAHFGTHDYAAACGIVARHQNMLHPACDFAKHVMQVTLAGTGVWLSDGSTNVIPLGPHRPTPNQTLTAAQLDDNRRAVHHAWRLQAAHVRHSHVGGFYQGWDLHPAQLPARYAAVYAFFLEDLDVASTQLLDLVRRATLSGIVFDHDAAVGRGLLIRFERAMNCGALTEEETVAMTGLTLTELHSKSFPTIVAQRRRPGSTRSP